MKKVRITVVRKANYLDLQEKYENHLDSPCDIKENQVFISLDATKPNGLCESAWETMEPFVRKLANGEGNFFDGWMKNPNSALISCNDGFRPVSFLIETLEEE